MESNKKPMFVREQPVTYDEYAAMPNDGKRYEVADGELWELSPGASITHQSISGQIEFLLKQSCMSEYYIFDAALDVILYETPFKMEGFQPPISSSCFLPSRNCLPYSPWA
ncbi:MAG: Uma2 family endonuclease [Paenibacillaceae bacterium]|nr:Uma2 family endonuclease [Paenibacillaceae bacterium]